MIEMSAAMIVWYFEEFQRVLCTAGLNIWMNRNDKGCGDTRLKNIPSMIDGASFCFNPLFCNRVSRN